MLDYYSSMQLNRIKNNFVIDFLFSVFTVLSPNKQLINYKECLLRNAECTRSTMDSIHLGCMREKYNHAMKSLFPLMRTLEKTNKLRFSGKRLTL
jgi:hypothetical protein